MGEMAVAEDESQERPLAPVARRSWTKARNAAMPAPGPIMMMSRWARVARNAGWVATSRAAPARFSSDRRRSRKRRLGVRVRSSRSAPRR